MRPSLINLIPTLFMAWSVFLAVPRSKAEHTHTLLLDKGSPGNAPERHTFIGKIVCLHEVMHTNHDMALPAGHAHVFGFEAGEDGYFLLLKNTMSEALFIDPRLRERTLQLTAWLFPHTRILDIASVKSIHNAVLHDLFYYCDICAIRSVSPGLCMCCQEEVELRELPLPKANIAP